MVRVLDDTCLDIKQLVGVVLVTMQAGLMKKNASVIVGKLLKDGMSFFSLSLSFFPPFDCLN